ncbi:MAG TPA: 2-amino-4-hydroxy-6-hydroxymethyldihydropteridine diphosphokinase [Flavipsychrobacter sp.]|nr:2-amino-4-hydroxy-6-hydroxymethyldihydropteridine diphosphokinase [Flavipsychrobacter sp.]
MEFVYLLLGSNEGDRQQWLRDAVQEIVTHCGRVRNLSSLYETAAWGLEDQPDFLNLVMRIETNLAPQTLLESIQAIEQRLGRQRQLKWGQRTLDIDILFYGKEIIQNESLKVPHPYLQDRKFTLLPLQEIAPQWVHPVLKETITTLLQVCQDKLQVQNIGKLEFTKGGTV